MLTAKNFIRTTLRQMLVEEIQAAVPKDMLALKQMQQRV